MSGFRFQVSAFRFQVSGSRFQVSGFRFQAGTCGVILSLTPDTYRSPFATNNSAFNSAAPAAPRTLLCLLSRHLQPSVGCLWLAPPAVADACSCLRLLV